MNVSMEAKTLGTATGGGVGAVAATKYGGALTVLTIHYLALDPATPAEVLTAWNDLAFGIYFVAITAAAATITRLLSPKKRKEIPDAKPVPPVVAPVVPGA